MNKKPVETIMGLVVLAVATLIPLIRGPMSALTESKSVRYCRSR